MFSPWTAANFIPSCLQSGAAVPDVVFSFFSRPSLVRMESYHVPTTLPCPSSWLGSARNFEHVQNFFPTLKLAWRYSVFIKIQLRCSRLRKIAVRCNHFAPIGIDHGQGRGIGKAPHGRYRATWSTRSLNCLRQSLINRLVGLVHVFFPTVTQPYTTLTRQLTTPPRLQPDIDSDFCSINPTRTWFLFDQLELTQTRSTWRYMCPEREQAMLWSFDFISSRE